jgi:hypothetical protein
MNGLNKQDIGRFIELKRINSQSEHTIFHQSRMATHARHLVTRDYYRALSTDGKKGRFAGVGGDVALLRRVQANVCNG